MTEPSSAPPRPTPGPSRRRLWLLAAAVLLGVLTGLLEPDESALRGLRLRLRPHAASGAVTVLAIDDASYRAVGKWPIPRGLYGRAVDRLFALGAARVIFSMDFSARQDPVEDARFAAAIRAHPGRVYLAGRVVGDVGGDVDVALPQRSIRGTAPLANSSFLLSDAGLVLRLPYVVDVDGVRYPGLATSAARFRGAPSADGQFDYDPSVRLATIPTIGLAALLAGRTEATPIAGRTILVGSTAQQVPDYFVVPPYGRIPGVILHAVGTETLLQGRPFAIAWYYPLLAAALLLAACARRDGRRALPVVLAAATALPFVPVLLPGRGTMAVCPALATLLLYGGGELIRTARRMLRAREQTNRLSGLRNLTALRLHPDEPGRRLVVAHVQNFAEALASLPAETEGALVAQVADRIKLGLDGGELYHGDNGVFAWFADEGSEALGERLDGLHALFRIPVSVPGATVDPVVTFGVDDDGARSVASRLGSALVAAAEAAADGTRWRAFDKARLADAAWKLSLLSQLDAAIDDGHLWVAYQPKLDLATGRLTGAEALVRWTHPEKGAISPIEFVAAAEQSNRIERLTTHVLERAILAAATINAHGIPFGMAVNLSARLLESRAIVGLVADALHGHGLDPALLTLEITETASIAGGDSLAVLHALHALGLRISIDDYGTGLSTLDYLKKVPASEIKIDRSFVQAMTGSTGDLLMVNSTIQLAHSLGHLVVAEGVETDETLARLRELGCDVAQGYRIGRPMTFQDLARRLVADRRHAA